MIDKLVLKAGAEPDPGKDPIIYQDGNGDFILVEPGKQALNLSKLRAENDQLSEVLEAAAYIIRAQDKMLRAWRIGINNPNVDFDKLADMRTVFETWKDKKNG